MKSKILIMGLILFMGCSTKNASQKVDIETRNEMNKVYKQGQELSNFGNRLEPDVRGTIKQSIRTK